MRILLAVALVLALAVTTAPAGAATPATGAVGQDQPTQGWEGVAFSWAVNVLARTERETCVAPTCDTFLLEVKDPEGLTLSVSSPRSSGGYVDVQVKSPDGTVVHHPGQADSQDNVIEYEDAQVGTYRIRTWTNQIFGVPPYDGKYTGKAVLGTTPDPAPPADAGWSDGRLALDVPVPVITFGVPEAAAADLGKHLRPLAIDSGVVTDAGVVTLEDIAQADVPGHTYGPNPMLPTAQFRVTRAPDELEQPFRQLLEDSLLEPGVYDANRIEDWLATELGHHGLAPNPNAPSIVLLHLDGLGAGSHQWKYAGPNGYRKRTRVFGERRPLLVLDPSARTDPIDPDSGDGGYRGPVAASDAVEMARMVTDATEMRILQGPLFPISPAPCHAVTAILAISEANYAEATGLMRRVEDSFDPEMIKAAFEGLTGTPTHFDVKILRMPADDPALDALSRPGYGAAAPMRAHLEANWHRYHVAHAGCAEYLTATFVGDAGHIWGTGVAGVAAFDARRGRGIGLGWVPELSRLHEDYRSPLWAPLIGTMICADSQGRDENDDCSEDSAYFDEYQLWNTLITHETGHLFGQRHPHDVTEPDGRPRTNFAFSTGWTTMSYAQINRVFDFGAIDRANWLRNRVGATFAEAARAGRSDSPEWDTALEATGRLDWEGAWRALAAGATG